MGHGAVKVGMWRICWQIAPIVANIVSCLCETTKNIPNMFSNSLQQRIANVLEQHPTQLTPLHGGMIADVYRVDLPNSERVVAKVANPGQGTLDIEGYMLIYLQQHSNLPVPDVLHSEQDLLIVTFVEGSSHLTAEVQRHAAELLADLHSVNCDQFGLERDTLIGPLHQPNPRTESWITFFRDHRLLYMAREAANEGALPMNVLRRIETFVEHLPDYLDEPEKPALIHGDVWTTNVLAKEGRVTGFVDPACYYAHPEMELAYTSLFGSMGQAFFERYNDISPIAPGFFEQRRDIYNLYPLLVHVRVFGGGYVGSVQQILQKFGF